MGLTRGWHVSLDRSQYQWDHGHIRPDKERGFGERCSGGPGFLVSVAYNERWSVPDSFTRFSGKVRICTGLCKDTKSTLTTRFYPSGRKSSHVRTSFSLVDLEVDADLGFQRLAEAIRDKRKQLGLE
jgi:hypothetical protein